MNYKNLMEEQTRSVFDAAIATKILQHISKVRDSSGDGQARRWIWELIQNAKDAAFPNEPVNIRVELTQNELIFSHTGRPFSIRGILSIINQVSSKVPEDEDTTGKFGTGFVTTHLLSEVVKLKSIISDVDANGEQLPYKPFEVKLDRSGYDQAEVLNAVNDAVNIIENIDEVSDITFDKNLYNTSFSYELNTDNSKEIANLGIDDLKYSIIYALAFVKNIAQIEIINNPTNENKIFTIDKQTPTGTENITYLSIIETSNNQTIEHNLLIAKDGKSMVAVPISSDKYFVEIDNNTPKVFVDFPLIGSEEFPFPAVCNSSEFLPNEPRSSISVIDNELSITSSKNKEILLECMELYNLILLEASNQGYEKFYNILKFSNINPNLQLHQQWIENNVFNRLRICLKDIPMIKLANGEYVAVDNKIVFPMSDDEEEILKVGNILKMIKDFEVPDESEFKGWCKAFKSVSTNKTKFIKLDLLVEDIMIFNLKEDISRIDFIQEIYNTVLKNEALLIKLNIGELELIPDQSEPFVLCNVKEIYKDVGLDENLKMSVKLLNKCLYNPSVKPYHIYNKLVHQDFDLGDNTTINDAPINDITNYITRQTGMTYLDYYYTNFKLPITEALIQLVCCCDDEYWFDFSKNFYSQLTIDKEHKVSQFYNADIWKNAITYMIYLISFLIEDCKDLKILQFRYFKEKTLDEVTYELKNFFIKSSEMTTAINKMKIFPNQYDEFEIMENLYLEDEYTDEKLKIIAKKLISLNVTDYNSVLLSKKIGTLDNQTIKTISNIEIANNIVNAITTLFNQKKLSQANDEIQEACSLLFDWIQNNDNLAQTLFPSFCSEDNRMKLLTPESIYSAKSKKLDNLLSEFGFNSIEELGEHLNSITPKENPTQIPDYNDDTAYKFESDIDFEDEYFDGWDCDEKESYGKDVGNAGEKFGFDILCQKWLDDGYVQNIVDTQTALFEKEGNLVELFFGDSEEYNQSGWDIRETINDDEPNFYEVKTTISTKRKSVLKLSPTQANNAYTIPTRFKIISIHLSRDLESVLDYTIFENILEKIQSQELSIEKTSMILYVR